MNIEEILKNWKMCGAESEDKFSLINHYTILFDDKDKGFDYLFEHLEIDKDKLLNTTNPKIHQQIMEIDNGMKDVSFLIENFITNYLWKDVDVEDVKNEIDILREDIKEVYGIIRLSFETIKSIIEEGSDEKIQTLH